MSWFSTGLSTYISTDLSTEFSTAYQPNGEIIMEKEKKPGKVVAKKNSFIQTTRYEMSAQQQKLLLYMVSKIKPTDRDFTTHTYNLWELCEVLGVEKQLNNRQSILKSLKQIRDGGFFYKIEDTYRYSGWVSAFEADIDKGEVTIEFDSVLAPYLLNLSEAYTMYDYSLIVGMESKYSIRLYEIIKSYANLRQFEVTVEELRALMQITGYEEYKEFKRRVLTQAVLEINKMTDLFVICDPVREGKCIKKIRFMIFTKKLEDGKNE